MQDEERLTSLVPAGGCARKLPAEDLAALLASLAPLPHAWVDPAVGPMDDAAIVSLPSAPPLVFTVDFITPVVDDAESFGAISAAVQLVDHGRDLAETTTATLSFIDAGLDAAR